MSERYRKEIAELRKQLADKCAELEALKAKPAPVVTMKAKAKVKADE